MNKAAQPMRGLPRQLVQRGSDALFDPALERGLRRRAGAVGDHLAALEHDQRRDAAHAVLGGERRVLVDVDANPRNVEPSDGDG